MFKIIPILYTKNLKALLSLDYQKESVVLTENWKITLLMKTISINWLVNTIKKENCSW